MKPMTESQLEYRSYINKVVEFRSSVFNEIKQKNKNPVWLDASLKDIENVVLINSAPRSGSSLLFAILREIPQIYSLSGESVPFFKLNGFASDIFPSDRIPDELMKALKNDFNLSRDFLSDFSVAGCCNEILHNEDLRNQYIDDLMLRFSLQWPLISFSYETFKALAKEAFIIYRQTYQTFCKEKFYLLLIKCLRRKDEKINPYYYDISFDLIKKEFPGIEVPSAPPNDFLTIEEPSFILLSPRKKVIKNDLHEKTLLLKTPINCYRMNYFETLFPNAKIKIIHLARNPLASINGLYDGWLYRGFFSHNLKYFFNNNGCRLSELKIKGYSDKNEWGRWWWNYDLAPGWQDYTEKSLQEVCAFQWYSANKTIQEYIDNRNISYCHVKHENIVGNLYSRVAEIRKITDFLGIEKDVVEMLKLDSLPVVQATSSPDPFRWKKRREILLPFLDDPKISKMCQELGYDKENYEEWI